MIDSWNQQTHQATVIQRRIVLWWPLSDGAEPTFDDAIYGKLFEGSFDLFCDSPKPTLIEVWAIVRETSDVTKTVEGLRARDLVHVVFELGRVEAPWIPMCVVRMDESCRRLRDSIVQPGHKVDEDRTLPQC